MNEDPQLSEMLLYVLKEGNNNNNGSDIDSDGHLSLFTGKTTVGRNIGSDIQLAGTLVTRNHWYVHV